MQTAVRPYAMAGATLLGAGLGAGIIAGGSAAPTVPDPEVASPAVQLTAEGLDDVANIPMNLFYDIVNIPANEINAIDEFAQALFYAGTWLITSPTNLWGIDPGDPPKIDSLIDMLLPIPALADPLEEQINGYLEAETPTNTACDTVFCVASPDLLNGYNQVSTDELMSGYTFPDSGETVEFPNYVQNAASNLEPMPDWVPTDGHSEVHEGSAGDTTVMPWAGTEFTLDPGAPLNDFFDSLTQDPSDNALTPFPDVFQTFTDLVESLLVPFNPFLEGGPFNPEGGLDTVFQLANGFDLSNEFDQLVHEFDNLPMSLFG
jgi:hypothetical protein